MFVGKLHIAGKSDLNFSIYIIASFFLMTNYTLLCFLLALFGDVVDYFFAGIFYRLFRDNHAKFKSVSITERIRHISFCLMMLPLAGFSDLLFPKYCARRGIAKADKYETVRTVGRTVLVVLIIGEGIYALRRQCAGQVPKPCRV